MAYTIVFIDESEHLLQGFRRTLPEDELHLIRVGNGEEGARTARDIRPDAVSCLQTSPTVLQHAAP